MSDQSPSIPPVLESAWKRFADYDNTAEHLQDQYYLLRRWVLYFSIIATFLAILLDNFRELFIAPVVTFLQVLLILVPITGSVIVAFISKFQQGQKYLALRAGAEEILKEIFFYRTIMRSNLTRNKWLNNRLATIQRQVHRTLGGEVGSLQDRVHAWDLAVGQKDLSARWETCQGIVRHLNDATEVGTHAETIARESDGR